MAPLTPQQLKEQIRNVNLSGEFGLANPEDPKSYGRYTLGITKEETKEKNGKIIKSSKPVGGGKIQIELPVTVFQCGVNEMSTKKDDGGNSDNKKVKWQLGYKVIGTEEEIHDVVDCRETTRKIGYVKSSILKKVNKIEALSEKGEDHKCFFLEVKPGEKIKVYQDEDCKGDSTEIVCPELPEGCDPNLHLDAPVMFAYEDDMISTDEGKEAPETFRVEYGWNDGIFELLNQRNAQVLYEEAVIKRNQLVLDSIPIERTTGKGKTKLVHWRTIASRCYSYEKRARNAVVSYSRDKATGEIVQKDEPLSHAFFTELLSIAAGVSKKGGKPYPAKNTTFQVPSKKEDGEPLSFTKEQVNEMLENKQTEGILVININCQYKPGNNMDTIRVKPQVEAVVFTKLEKKKMNDPAREILKNVKSQISSDDFDEFAAFKKTGVSRNDDEEKQGFIHKSKGKVGKSKAPKVEDEDDDDNIPVTSSKSKKNETPKKNKKEESEEEEEKPKSKSKPKKEESEEEEEKPKKSSKSKKEESDDEEKPKKSSKKNEEEEEEEKPKKSSKPKKEESDEEEEKPKSKSKPKKEESEEEEEVKPKKSSKKNEEEEEEDEEKPKSKSKPKKEEEDDEDKPKKSSKPKKEESDDEDKPKKSSKKNEDDEEEEKPKSKSKPKKEESEEEEEKPKSKSKSKKEESEPEDDE